MKIPFKNRKNRYVAMFSDVTMILVTWINIYSLFTIPQKPFIFFSSIILFTCLQSSIFYMCGLYRGMWRFASIPDLIRIVRAVLIGTLSIFLIVHGSHQSTPLAIYFFYSMQLILLLSGTRILFRWLRDYSQLLTSGQRVLIIGAGNAGEGIARDLIRMPNKQFHPIAFVDDDVTCIGREIHGIRVMGNCEKIPELVVKLDIQLILIAVPSAGSTDMRRIVNYCEQAKTPFRTLPGLKDLAEGNVNINALRPVLLEDLLGREQAQLEWDKIKFGIADKTILVSGGGGSIGAELCRQIVEHAPKCLVILDNSEFNIYSIDMEIRKKYPNVNLHCFLSNVTDRVGLKKIFQQFHPEIIFHAAAYKHVPLLETQLRAAVFNNIVGTRILGEVASEFKVKKFLLISTDKAVNPTNIMGATKRAAEVFCQNMNFYSETDFITVRFGNVLDSAGSVVPLFRKQLKKGGPLTVTHPEITRFFMTIPEASQLILQAITMGKGGEIFVLDMGEPIKIRYLAEQMIKLSGKKLGHDIEIQYTGLRPGEKLYEELFYEGEQLSITSHVKINKANVRRYDWNQLTTILDEIEIACNIFDEKGLNQLLHQLVPEYKNKNTITNLENTYLRENY